MCARHVRPRPVDPALCLVHRPEALHSNQIGLRHLAVSTSMKRPDIANEQRKANLRIPCMLLTISAVSKDEEVAPVTANKVMRPASGMGKQARTDVEI